MPRGLAILIIMAALIVGALYLLSNQAEDVPTRPIEVPVEIPANAG